jgi:hypothetical protein
MHSVSAKAPHEASSSIAKRGQKVQEQQVIMQPDAIIWRPADSQQTTLSFSVNGD